MALITRTAMIDDNGTGETGTVLNNDWKQEFYNQIDALAQGVSTGAGDVFKNAANVFTQNQTIDKALPALVLHHGGTAKNRLFSANEADVWLTRNLFYDGANWNLDNTALTGGTFGHDNAGNLAYYTVTAGANPRTLNSRFTVNGTTGNATISGSLTIGGTLTTGAGGVSDASLSANVALKNINNNFTVGQTITGNLTLSGALNAAGVLYPGLWAGGQQTWGYLATDTNYGLRSNTGLHLAGGLWVTAAATLSSTLTVGAITSGAITTTGTITANAGHMMCGYYLYPGYVSGSGTIQSNYFIAAHTTYGLYANTSMYFAGAIYMYSGSIVADYIRASGTFYELGRGTAQGIWTDFTPTLSGATMPAIYSCRYTWIGRTMLIQVYGQFSIPVAGASFSMTIPAGCVSSVYSCTALTASNGQGMCQSTPGGASLIFYRDAGGTGVWPVGGMTMGVNAIIMIN